MMDLVIICLNYTPPAAPCQRKTKLLYYISNMRTKNTQQKGSIRYIVFKDEGVWYAVALEFNIIESGDEPREALLSLFEAINGYIKTARKVKARTCILNQKVDKEYETLWRDLNTANDTAPKIKMSDIFTFGRQSVAAFS